MANIEITEITPETTVPSTALLFGFNPADPTTPELYEAADLPIPDAVQAALDAKASSASVVSAVAAEATARDSAIATHSADTTGVHGIADTSALETQAGAQTKATAAQTAAETTAAAALSTHTADTTAVHGIADTTALIMEGDSRLTDARTPTAHNQAWSTITSTPTTLAGYGITDAASDTELAAHESDTTSVHGIADTSAIVLTNDSRLTNSRTPTSHASTHAAAGGDPLTLTTAQLSDFNSATRAQVEAELIAGTNVTITPGSSGATRTLTIAASGGGGVATAVQTGAPSSPNVGDLWYDTDDTTVSAGDLSGYAALSGATFTGPVSVPAPTAAGHAATKSYVDAAGTERIEVKNLVADAANISFTVPSTARNVRIVGDLRGTAAAVFVGCTLRINGDTGANYDTAQMGTTSGSTNNQFQVNATAFNLYNVQAATATANRFSPLQIVVTNLQSSHFKGVIAQTHMWESSTFIHTMQLSGTWNSPSVVTTITILPGSGNWAAGSSLTAYYDL